MSIDLTQQALNALADAGLGNDTPAEAFVIGYQHGHDDAISLAVSLEHAINQQPASADEIEHMAQTLYETHDGTLDEQARADDDKHAFWHAVATTALGVIYGTEETA